MGRKLDLSKLTDEEAKHVWEVIQRDFDLRKKEEERLEELKGRIQKESTKKELISDQAHLNETHCGHCLQPYRFLVNSKRQCVDCHLYTCKNCSSYNHREQSWICDPCRLARVVKTGSLEWYYEHVRSRFKRFGSAKVMRSLYGRLQSGHSTSPVLGPHSRAYSLPDVHSEAQLFPTGDSGESERTSEDESLPSAGARHLNREKRLLSVHPFDFEVDSDYSAQSRPQPVQLSPAPATLDSPQFPSDAPSADDEEAGSQKDTLLTNASLSPESQDAAQEEEQSNPEISQPLASILERRGSPDPDAMGSDQPQLHYFADMDTSDEDIHNLAAHLPQKTKHRSRTSSQDSMAHSDDQIFEMNQRILAMECLLARLEDRILVPWDESFGPGSHTDADIEEEALKRKLGELTSKVSDKAASSEEEEEDQSELTLGKHSVPDTGANETQQVTQEHGRENRLLDLEEQATDTRTPDSALSELEDRVALTVTEVQHAKKEVSDIRSRIAALSAAGLPVKTWEKPRKKSNLQIFPLQPANSLEEEDPELSGPTKVMPRPLVQRRIFNNSLRLQDREDDPFIRKSVYRGSLTQRNPNGKSRKVDHIFAKPVMTHQP